MLFDIIFLTVSVGVQSQIALELLRFIRHRVPDQGRAAAYAGLVLFEIGLVVGYICTLSDRLSKLPVPRQAAMVVGAVTLVYLILSAAMYVLYVVLRMVRSHFEAKVSPGRRQALGAISNVVMAAPFVGLGFGILQRNDFHVREADIPMPGLPADLDGLRILQISDIHLSPFLSEAQLARVIDAAVGVRAHLAVVTGDLISQRGDPLDACIRQLARLKADAGVFGCMGNHERYARSEKYTEEAAARVGIRFLRQRSEQLRFGGAVLNLAGVDHQSTAGGKHYLHGAEKMVMPGATNVLLSHNPDVFPVAASQGYNLMLSGHTHGGQVTVEILDQSISPARFLTPYVYGLYRSGALSAYVTRGIGTIAIPARIGAPPEISVLRLRKA